MNNTRIRSASLQHAWAAAALRAACMVAVSAAQKKPAKTAIVVLGVQYDTTHVYVRPEDLDAFVNSFVATFGGQPSARIVPNVLPIPSSTQFQAVSAPGGELSAFPYQTRIPYPFGQE